MGLDHIAADLRSLARPIESLTPDPRNARRHPVANMASIEASLRAHGQRKPVVVRSGVVVAGNGTLEIAKKLGWTHLAAVEFEGTESQARAFAVADNRSGELAEWDNAELASALLQAKEDGFLAATGFSDEDARAILASASAGRGGEDPGPGEVPEVAVSKPGEIYALGPTRLVCPCCGEDMS